jgi:predicted DNA-binding transcriptional regulator AlpA
MPSRTKNRPPLPPTLVDAGFIRLPAVLELFPVGQRSWYPKPVKLGPRTVAWRVKDIQRLLASLSEDAE